MVEVVLVPRGPLEDVAELDPPNGEPGDDEPHQRFAGNESRCDEHADVADTVGEHHLLAIEIEPAILRIIARQWPARLGARITHVAPKIVSTRVVNTRIFPKSTSVPSERPIQFRCISFNESLQLIVSRSFNNFSA